MARVAEEAKIPRESLYGILSEGSNPTLDTLSSILKAVNLRIQVAPEIEEASLQQTKNSVAVDAAPPSVTITEILGVSGNITLNEAQTRAGLSFNACNSLLYGPVSFVNQISEETSLWNLPTQRPQPQLAARLSIENFLMNSFSPTMQTPSSFNQEHGI
jgi:hypothetical protein